MVAQDNLPKHRECNKSGEECLYNNSKKMARICSPSKVVCISKTSGTLRKKNIKISSAVASEN